MTYNQLILSDCERTQLSDNQYNQLILSDCERTQPVITLLQYVILPLVRYSPK